MTLCKVQRVMVCFVRRYYWRSHHEITRLLHRITVRLHFADVCVDYWQCGFLGTGMVLNCAEKEGNGMCCKTLEARFSKTNLTIVCQLAWKVLEHFGESGPTQHWRHTGGHHG
jgi:hypothetical protein